MKKIIALLTIILVLFGCSDYSFSSESNNEPLDKAIIGTWKLVYSKISTQDSTTIKDLSTSEFIKIINKTHFAFFNQNVSSSDGFYAGAGTYTLKGNDYIEVLDFIANEDFRGHTFPFSIEIKGDTLIQSGLEEIESANIKRFIVEKYIKLKENK